MFNKGWGGGGGGVGGYSPKLGTMEIDSMSSKKTTLVGIHHDTVIFSANIAIFSLKFCQAVETNVGKKCKLAALD